MAKQARPQKWIQGAIKKPGALRRQLGLKPDEAMSMSMMNNVMDAEVGDEVEMNGTKVRVTALMKRRMALAKTLGKMRKG